MMNRSIITEATRILVPSGRDYERCIEAFQKEFDVSVPEFEGRKLVTKAGGRAYIKVKGKDIPKLIAQGYGDIGLTGTDVCIDRTPAVSNIAYGAIGKPMCTFDLLLPKTKSTALLSRLKNQDAKPVEVATSFPNLLRQCLEQKREEGTPLNLTICPVVPSGSVEIMPELKVSEAVADLLESGETAQANNLTRQKLIDIYPAILWRESRENIMPLKNDIASDIQNIDMTLTERKSQVENLSVNSYTLERLRDRNLAVKKFGEEVAEFQESTRNENQGRQTGELADLVYSALVLSEVKLVDVINELAQRNKSNSINS